MPGRPPSMLPLGQTSPGPGIEPGPGDSPRCQLMTEGPAPAGGVGCRAAGAAHVARRAGHVPGRPAANPRRGCRLRAPSRSAAPRRSHEVASRSRSAHAARAPRTAAFDGSQESPSFRRVARPGLSLRLRSKAHRNRLRSGCAHITVVYRAHVPDTHGDARCGNLAITVVPPVMAKFHLARPSVGDCGNRARRRSPGNLRNGEPRPSAPTRSKGDQEWETGTGTAS